MRPPLVKNRNNNFVNKGRKPGLRRFDCLEPGAKIIGESCFFVYS